MTINEAIELLDKLKPNAYDRKDKVRWLSELEGQITEEILGPIRGGSAAFEPLDPETDGETELIAEGTYADIYVKYLCAQVDYHNGDWTRYNNSVTMYQAGWDLYAAYMRRRHKPEAGAKFRI